MLMMGGSFLLLLLNASIWMFLVVMVIFVVGEMLWVPTSQAIAAELAPEDLRGAYMGAFNSTGSLGFALGRSSAALLDITGLATVTDRRGTSPGSRRRRDHRSGGARPRPAGAGGRDRGSASAVRISRDGGVPCLGAGACECRGADRGRDARPVARRGDLRGDLPRGAGRRLLVRPRRERAEARSVLALPARGDLRTLACRRDPDRRQARALARRARDLRAPRRCLLGGGDLRRRHPAPRGVARYRRDGDRADAGATFPGTRLGLRRRLPAPHRRPRGA
jgi:hypothetical protein